MEQSKEMHENLIAKLIIGITLRIEYSTNTNFQATVWFSIQEDRLEFIKSITVVLEPLLHAIARNHIAEALDQIFAASNLEIYS